MSYYLALFVQNQAIDSYESFRHWFDEQTEWGENRDYNDVIGTAPQLTACFQEIKKRFPPLNGPHSLSDEAFGDAETERHLTDYSIGSEIIYASFGWSVAEEAYRDMKALAEANQVGFYDCQSGEFFCPGVALAKIRNEQGNERCINWSDLEHELNTVDLPERGTSNHDNAFVTFWFESETASDNVFMQCMPKYGKSKGAFKRLFAAKAESSVIEGYTVEVCTGDKIFSTHVTDKQQLIQLFRGYYESRELPDITEWEDTGIL